MNMKSMSMYSTQYLVGASFCLNYCSNAAWLVESISLWQLPGVMRAQVALIVAFSSSALLGLAYRHLLFTIPHRFSMGLRSGEFAGQLRTGIPWSLNQVLVAWPLCAGAKSVGKWNLHLHKVVSSRSMKCSKTSRYTGCVDPWTSENTEDQHQQMTWHPNHHWLWKLYTGPQATWILCLSSLPPDSGTLISKGNAQFTFIREHNFGPLSSSPVLFVFSPGETLLTLSVVSRVAWHKECDSWNPCLAYVCV